MAEYWHGGPRGLKGWILPSTETGKRSCADMPVHGSEVCRRDRVYLTTNRPTNRLAAEMFASMAPSRKVSVYLVEPVEPIEPDEDRNDPGLSFQSPKARIVKEFPMQPHFRRQMLQAVMVR